MPGVAHWPLKRAELPVMASLEQLWTAGTDGYVSLGEWLEEAPFLSRIFYPAPPGPLADSRVQPVLDPANWQHIPALRSDYGLSLLHEAACFGGRIDQRDWHGDQRLHYQGQLTLTRRGEVTRSAFNYMDGTPSLAGDLIRFAADDSMGLNPPWPATRLEGTYCLLGNLHRHFGHFLLEGLSRLWLLDRLSPGNDMKGFLVYEDTLLPFMVDILALAGIDRDRIIHVPATGIVVERLLVPDPAMLSHRRISAAQAGVYRRIARQVPAAHGSRRIFLSRQGVPDRPLMNQDEVENRFADLGFEIVQPETLGILDQIRLAREAAVLAGPVGSQMYLAAFQAPGTHTLVCAPRNFCLKDDGLLALAGGRYLKVVLGDVADQSGDKPGWQWRVDIHHLEAALAALLREGRAA